MIFPWREDGEKKRLYGGLELVVRFSVPPLYALVVLMLFRIGPEAPLTIIPGFAAILTIAALVPISRAGKQKLANLAFSKALLFRGVIWATITGQLLLIGWAACEAAHGDYITIAVLALTVGLGSGIYGLLAAHEFIHSPDPVENAGGLLMLTSITYRHFPISHLHGHHRWAATPRDPTTAHFGESAYAFLVRSVVGQFAHAWRFERRRVSGRANAFWRNRVYRDLLIYLALYSAVVAELGWRAAWFLIAQSCVAIVVLELFNYVAHYGLQRATMASGIAEPLSDIHSWNASAEIGNWLLFNMGHHSDHHRRAISPYQHLEPIQETPQLPGGYAGAIFFALVPPLWRHFMDPHVAQRNKRPTSGKQHPEFASADSPFEPEVV